MQNTYTVGYNCPACFKRVEREFSYINPSIFVNKKKAGIVVAFWCPKCGARHRIKYLIRLDEDKIRMNTFSFSCNDIEHKKKLRIKRLKIE